MDKDHQSSAMNSFGNMAEEVNLNEFYTKLMKQKILRQKYYYYLLSVMFNLNQLAHEVLDPPIPE